MKGSGPYLLYIVYKRANSAINGVKSMGSDALGHAYVSHIVSGSKEHK
ncbi:hypothetical protein JNUCC23_06490 [Peribacillus sp. JNUCC 23]